MNPAIIIPVYNHGTKIDEVIRQTRQLALPIFVIDDGSTDSTPEILAALDGITVLRHAENLGKGAALLTGFKAAEQQGHNWAISLDGDGQHKPEDAKQLLQATENTPRCLVVGKRQGMEDNANVPWTSRFGRGFSNFWVWAAGGPLLADSQSGFRLYPLPESLHLHVQAQRYQFEVEILVKARLHGLPVKEAPIQVVYQAKGVRVSHFQPWLDFRRNSTTFNRLIWERIFRIFNSILKIITS
ncbi:MAG: glycosyltransferase family 2 protein [Candidatus Electrothrix aestuarii]|uniref:Glycosyltransferase family 2 protein n=1 Tax=Candidatus Electrothrix aestuarii TaxID=3062594 RepID=A0AAU8LYG7_9BACT|nr:glycosyltransferase family 2 protein [Candidatus Electrothrix aestuarii]